jgi:hypothetical protein
MWAGLSKYYGLEKASMIMPMSFNLRQECEKQLNSDKIEDCNIYKIIKKGDKAKKNENKNKEEQEKKKNIPKVFILKNPILHTQKGLLLSTSSGLLSKMSEVILF